jgi:hypothetical protein
MGSVRWGGTVRAVTTGTARVIPIDQLVLERMRRRTLREIGAALALHHEQVRRRIEQGDGHRALADLTRDLEADGETAVLIAWDEDFTDGMAMWFWCRDELRHRWPDLHTERCPQTRAGVEFKLTLMRRDT